jgi:hypothetical protein
MTSLRPFLPLLMMAALLFSPDHSVAQDVPSSMRNLLAPLRELQPYMVSERAFIDRGRHDEIKALIHELRTRFHSLESVPSRYKSLPGFQDNLRNLAELLDDAERRFSEGKTSYAWWRLQRVPTDCFSCHATYKVESRYSNSEVIAASLDPVDRARFLLATRQFSEAKVVLLNILHDSSNSLHFSQALRSLLLVETRISRDPKEAGEVFQALLSSTHLPEDVATTVKTWIQGFSKWSSSKTTKEGSPLHAGEKLILTGASRGIDFKQDEVALLRGTALVHEALESQKLSAPQRRKALYLLGFAYTQLRQFFTGGWGEMYLEQCIHEFPKTQESKWAFSIYRETVVGDFTGSGGSHLPDEIKLHLEDLRRIAFGEQVFSPRL